MVGNAVYKFEIYAEYERWCKSRNEKYPSTDARFWRDTWTIWPGGNPGRKRRKQMEYFQLPELSEMRQAYTATTKIRFEGKIDDPEDYTPYDGQF